LSTTASTGKLSSTTVIDTLGDFTFWISLSLSVSLSPKFGLKPKISQKVKSFSLSDLLRPNFGLSDC